MAVHRQVDNITVANAATTNPIHALAGLTPPPWTEDALCGQTDPESFYPEKGGSTREAKAVCRRCPVAAECADYALEHEERFGIWGGLSERDRRRILKSQKDSA